MFKLLESKYDKETGFSFVRISTDIGNFSGFAYLNPEDKNIASSYLGCEIAEIRACINYYERRKSILNTKLNALYDLKRKIRNNWQFDGEHFEYKILEKEIHQMEIQKNIYKDTIKSLRKTIDNMVDNRIEILKRHNLIKDSK
jgi:hypothetical protein